MKACRLIQLDDGTTVIGMIHIENLDTDQRTMDVFNPVKVEAMKFQRGQRIFETYIMKPLMPLTDQDYVELYTKKIVFTTTVKKSFQEQYNLYINSPQYAEMPPNLTQDAFSEIGGEEPTEESFQEFLDNLIEEDETEDDETKIEPTRRTIH